MSKYPQSPEACMAKWLRFMKKETTYTPRTVDFYYETVHAATRILEENGLHTMPTEIDGRDVRALLDYMEEGHYAVSTRKGYISALTRYTLFYDNPAVKEMKIRWPHDSRPCVDWLTPDQIVKLKAVPKTPVQELGIHCMLCLGMRRIEVLRLRPEDIHDGYLTVWGKGPLGGKPRNIPFHRDTVRILGEFSVYRDGLISEARRRYPVTTVVPERLVISLRGGRLYEFDEDGWGWDKCVMKPLIEAVGFRFSNHTLRRTFGRAMWQAGVPIEIISQIYGHDSTSVTIRYIGINMDHMQSAMERCPL